MSDGNTTIQVPTGAGETTPASEASSGGVSFVDSIPAAYRDKPYMATILTSENPQDALFQQFDNAQQLIGRKSEGVKVPGEGATPEDWAAFNKSIGAPDSVDGFKYEGPVVEGENAEQIKAVLETLQSPDLVTGLQAAAVELGLRSSQFDGLVKVYNEHMLQEATAQLAAGVANKEATDAKFQEDFKKLFGDRSDTVFARAKEIAEKAIPESVRESGDPELFLYSVIDWVDKTYMQESTVVTKSGRVTTNSMEGIRSQINELRATDAYRNKFHPGHDERVAEVDELYKREARA